MSTDEEPVPLRVISYGGGVQSTALIVLAAQGVIDYPVAVIANVGDDSEAPETLAYVHDIATPWAAEHGITIHEVRRMRRDGTPFETLLEYHHANVARTGATPLPVKMLGDGPGGIANRTCTRDWKALPVSRWLRSQGATPENPAMLALGISTDEFHWVNTKHDKPWERRQFPLIDLGLSRTDCQRIIQDAGLPMPSKSACWFCPFHPRSRWAEVRRDDPERFDRVAGLEADMNAHRERLGKPPFWWTNRPEPLADLSEAQPTLIPFDGPEGCDEGYCWT